MKRHAQLEWDPRKAAANFSKHRVRFEKAAEALLDEFADRFHIEEPMHEKGEDRWMTLASYPYDRSIVYVIIWVEREEHGKRTTRIISARYTTPRERSNYEQATRQI